MLHCRILATARAGAGGARRRRGRRRPSRFERTGGAGEGGVRARRRGLARPVGTGWRWPAATSTRPARGPARSRIRSGGRSARPGWSLAAGEREAARPGWRPQPRCVRHEVVLGLLLRCGPIRRPEEANKQAIARSRWRPPPALLQTVASEGRAPHRAGGTRAWRAGRVGGPAAPGGGRTRGPPGRPERSRSARQPLTERERDVLRFLPSRLTVSEIADELYVSVNTLKFHLKVIYRKLGVGSRAEAAELARWMAQVRCARPRGRAPLDAGASAASAARTPRWSAGPAAEVGQRLELPDGVDDRAAGPDRRARDPHGGRESSWSRLAAGRACGAHGRPPCSSSGRPANDRFDPRRRGCAPRRRCGHRPAGRRRRGSRAQRSSVTRTRPVVAGCSARRPARCPARSAGRRSRPRRRAVPRCSRPSRTRGP